MGVSGSGKTSVGEQLAERLGWDFYDADNFHSPENITKMAQGIPLTDEDRKPWLASLRDLITASRESNRPGLLACSALKESYREMLTADDTDILIVYLKGSYDLIWSRMRSRPGHFMQPQMLQSQFEALEEPLNAITVDIARSLDEIVEEILSSLK
jgi:gluconokinase